MGFDGEFCDLILIGNGKGELNFLKFDLKLLFCDEGWVVGDIGGVFNVVFFGEIYFGDFCGFVLFEVVGFIVEGNVGSGRFCLVCFLWEFFIRIIVLVLGVVGVFFFFMVLFIELFGDVNLFVILVVVVVGVDNWDFVFNVDGLFFFCWNLVFFMWFVSCFGGVSNIWVLFLCNCGCLGENGWFVGFSLLVF